MKHENCNRDDESTIPFPFRMDTDTVKMAVLTTMVVVLAAAEVVPVVQE